MLHLVHCGVPLDNHYLRAGQRVDDCGRGINNVCDVLMYLEDDDTRDVGVIMTLPLFFPFLWFALWRKKRGWFMYATALAIFGYWLWQFFLRYQFCL